MTATTSVGRSVLKYSAVSKLTAEAEDAWWPPTFSPSLARAVLAWCTIHALSQSTRRWMRARMSRSLSAMAEYTAGLARRVEGPVRGVRAC